MFTAQKLAKLHKVHVKTIYKWKSNYYSDLEMITGKKLKPLRDISVALDELLASLPPKGKKGSNSAAQNSDVYASDVP